MWTYLASRVAPASLRPGWFRAMAGCWSTGRRRRETAGRWTTTTCGIARRARTGRSGAWTELPDESKQHGDEGGDHGPDQRDGVRGAGAGGERLGGWRVVAERQGVAGGGGAPGLRRGAGRGPAVAAVLGDSAARAAGGDGRRRGGDVWVVAGAARGSDVRRGSRAISGAAAEPSASASYTYTATDASGASASLSFTVEVEVSPEETALRRDALAAQGRALLASVTGVIGERFRARPSSSGEAARGGPGDLVQGLASMLGLRAGRSFGRGIVGPGFGTVGGRGGLPERNGLGPVGHPSVGAMGTGGHAGMGGWDAVPGPGVGAGPGGFVTPGRSGSLGGHGGQGGRMSPGHPADGSVGGLAGASAFGLRPASRTRRRGWVWERRGSVWGRRGWARAAGTT